jgi:predicted amidophosphoribosyltransferase
MMMGIPWFFIIAFIVVLVLISIGSKSRRSGASSSARLCDGCGAEHPAIAQYCRRCGKKL